MDENNTNNHPETKEPELQAQLIKSMTKHIGHTSSPSSNTGIEIDIAHKRDESGEMQPPRVLGEVVITNVLEGGHQILAIGQIVRVETQNKWHSDTSFKGVIKQFGTIPHLSGSADVRTAKLSVQSAFRFTEGGSLEPHVLGTSPSTGKEIFVLQDKTMKLLMRDQDQYITYLGKAYGADVSIPFRFKHFGDGPNGNRDAYHIGVFGKTGSGKTVMAAMMLLGYARNNKMSILILDPQSQFYNNDKKLLPENKNFKETIEGQGMCYEKYSLVDNIYLSDKDIDVLPDLLRANNFFKHVFVGTVSVDKSDEMITLIHQYFRGRLNNPSFSLKQTDSVKLLHQLLKYVSDDEKLGQVYSSKPYRDRLKNRIEQVLKEYKELGEKFSADVMTGWQEVLDLYSQSETKSTSIEELVDKVINEPGNCIIVNLTTSGSRKIENENLQALYISLIQKRILAKSSEIYEGLDNTDREVNALIVMDEAHRFASTNPSDPRMKEVSSSIVDAVRTTRKYGVGYMFITQSLDSLDEEILRQMRIYSFGFGLTIGTEFKRIREIVNNDDALDLYRSFIDPGSNNKYPFMFSGPISPLSFTGAPVFIESYKTSKELMSGLGKKTAGP